MMNEHEFTKWAASMDLSEEAKAEIQRIRQSPPARRVGGGRNNVSGRYSSKKMGMTIQFESHKVELPAIYMMEFNENVLEYYDQPPKIKVNYFQSKKNASKKMAYWYTADFFVIEKERAYWVECKTEEELIKKSQEKPDRYFRRNGEWGFSPGVNYATKFGLDFIVRSSSDINWILHRNLEFLADYIARECVPEYSIVSKIKGVILSSPGITLLDLIIHSEEQYTADDIYALITSNHIYIDLYNDLITEPENIIVFLNKEQYKSFSIVEKSSRKNKSSSKVDLKQGQRILWGDIIWEILHYDIKNKIVFLLKEGEKEHKEFPLEVFESYISDGYIEGINKESSSNDNLKELISQAAEKDLEQANKKYEIVMKVLNGEVVETQNVTQRTIRNWIKKYKDAEELYGNGFLGLLPKTKERGNRTAKLPTETKDMMEQMITENYATIKSKSAREVYREFIVKCEELKIPEASYKTFLSTIKQRSKYEIENARKGRRASYKYEEFYFELEFTTLKHGERIFNIAHIDHTELDIELDVGNGKSIRPWLTLMVDAFSRRILAYYLTFEPPSYRSCMMVIRQCVKNYNRLPNYIVVDGGKEFNSVYFESLLAFHRIHKKERPAAKARFGNVVERLFGITNQFFIHNLKGNTKITKNVRQVTKSVNPKNHAVWTLDSLNIRIESWINDVYDNLENKSLGQTPKEAYNESLVISGNRANTYIPYNDLFILMTLPSPVGRVRKVRPGQGIKLNYSHYWCDEFRNPRIESTSVEVKYDPFNIGIAYVFINNKWVKCLAEEFKYLNGKTEKEIQIIAEEIKKKRSLHSKSNSINAKMIARFIIESEIIEEQLYEEKKNNSPVKPDFKVITEQTNIDKNQGVVKKIHFEEDVDEEVLVDYGELPI
ncbi:MULTISPECIES: Mu transposase C-terminal domain-containing protein [Lysinibacillus]|uniref:Mu transposase C-terminal domain-containing protein n=1 Tax=Lysinibacillus TaxID=400634 RepID=UPI00214B6990|nr:MULTISPECIES: DDE-type integrase/transposase/recombinase [Lysinibacillus]UUV23642.1 DDE-type integrase/transposase/recombinase [Lysinibacillus sp. FN11]UYB46513.1 DDE-type integrase/transposase/recombinase [Lysinibacillus capsici]